MDVLSAVENTGGLFTEEVLIDSDEILVLQDSEGVFGDCVKVATNDERGLSECPKSKVRALLSKSKTTVSYLKHVRIIPSTRSSTLWMLIIDFVV